MTTQQDLCETKLEDLKEKKGYKTARGVRDECTELLNERNATFSKSLFSGITAKNVDLDVYLKGERDNRVEREQAKSASNRAIKEQGNAQAAILSYQQQNQADAIKKSKLDALGKYKSDSTGVWYSKCHPDDTDVRCIPKNLLGKETDRGIKPCEYLEPRWNGIENFNMIYDGTGKEKNGITPIAAMLEKGCGKLRNGQTLEYATGGKRSRRKKRNRKTKKYNIKK